VTTRREILIGLTTRRDTPIPDFFIVGSPKSATTALFEQLGSHPQIFVPRVKEPSVFGAEHNPSRRRMSFDEYLALFMDAGNAVRIGEGSTTYLYSRTAPSEIRDFNPNAQIIIMLRDPIEVMHSQHSEAVWSGFEPIRDFAAALEAQDRRRAEGLPPERAGPYYRDIVDFADHVSRYFDTFGRERVRVIVFDDWIKDTAGAYRQTLEFLEVDPTFVPSFRVVNPNRRIRSDRLYELIREPPWVLQRLTRPIIPAGMRRKIRRTLFELNSVVSREPLDPAVRARLRTEFAPEIERLGKLIDRDLSAWTRD